MSIPENYQPIYLEDLSSTESLAAVIKKVIAIRSDYWEKKIGSKNIITMRMNTKAQQLALLGPIVKQINKAVVPSDASLEALPVEYLDFEDFNSITGSSDVAEVIKAVRDVATGWQIGMWSQKEFFLFFVCNEENGDKPRCTFYHKKEVRGNRLDDGSHPLAFIDHLCRHYKIGRSKVCVRNTQEMTALWDLLNKKNCNYCPKSNVNKRCGACGIYYCDRNCQQGDWEIHKELCYLIRLFKLTLSEKFAHR